MGTDCEAAGRALHLSVGREAAAAAAVASSIRIALEDMVTAGADPETAYVRTLVQFTSGPLVAAPRRLPGMGSPPRHVNLTSMGGAP